MSANATAAGIQRFRSSLGAHGADGETFAYKRIRFAAPPIGDARFAPPTPAACPDGDVDVDATAFGPVCPQLDGDTFVGDEDCLHLNVWAPAAAAAPRPVMVWIHGGANSVGSAVYSIYDGRRLAEAGDVVVVTANYGLGQLGYLGHAAFADGSGVFGLLDQIAALAWVRDNISAFGGDPANVTIFGESAGARNVCSLVAAPPARGLFHRAIMQSGACKFLPSRALSEQAAADVVAAVGCAGAADIPTCLRALPAEMLIRALPAEASAIASSPYKPMIDGVVQTDQPEHVIAAGAHAAVPFMVGANADETGNAIGVIATEAQYEAAVRAMFPQALADQVLVQYPASAFPTSRAALVRLTTDSRFVCPSREIARAADAGQTAPAYRYFFQYREPNVLGAVHGFDVPFVFGTFDAVVEDGPPYQPTANDLAVAALMQRAWTSFARTGEPSTTPAWPAYDPSDPALAFDASPTIESGIRAGDCDFWEPFYDSL